MIICVCTAIRVSVRNNNIWTKHELTIYYNMHYLYIITIVIGIIRQQLLNHYNIMCNIDSDGR